MQTHALAGKGFIVTTWIHFMWTKKSIHFDSEVHKHTQWMLSIPYSEKLLPSLQWMETFRNTRNCGTPWSTQGGHSFISAKILWGTKHYTFPSWNWTHTVRPTQGCSSKWLWGLNQISTSQWMANWTRNITHTPIHTNTHTHTISDDILIVI
jgi:hypothetical protein